ncbi:thiolase family protein [Conexibacter sp. JD483]|uniref:thiolase family protein n=1 Tax=unclassified Conexibacter TaxID=2627773 RepID=UPI00271AA416|nr:MULTISPECIES: thiolase family protein [unclassified Conexibacter]MDO8185576.1 thiolase family protein [Conexibacter sp. CPCC 205706]MDO8198749.1 thiolase family protein [Conexibacter sp. CPCC 205762]MDR9367901.1 thiolase family protein [Conexibacter sp. JD483]
MSELNEAWIVAAARTPIGKLGGELAAVRPDDLAATVVAAVVERAGIAAETIEDVVLGCANQAGEDNRDVARMAGLLAGLPETVGGTTINRLCGSGLDAVSYAARALMVGDGDAFVAGGVESMSRAPWAVAKPAKGYATGPNTMEDTSLGWRFTNPRMDALGHTDALGVTAENLVAEKPETITRAAQDQFALASHQKALAAQAGDRFARELVPVTVKERKGERVVASDEGPRADSSLATLSKLKPAFVKDGSGTVTAGNSSSLNDGAAALVMVSPQYAREHGLQPLAKIRALATAGVAPRVMGIGPVPATAKALDRAGITLNDLDLIELNEAFAAQSLAVLDAWGVPFDDARVNVNGGAIALGHPLGCSGARLLTTLVHELRRRDDATLGLATMCIGVGQGIAVVVERMS